MQAGYGGRVCLVAHPAPCTLGNYLESGGLQCCRGIVVLRTPEVFFWLPQWTIFFIFFVSVLSLIGVFSSQMVHMVLSKVPVLRLSALESPRRQGL